MLQNKLQTTKQPDRKIELNEISYFFFRERRGHFDWRALAGVEVDKVIKEVVKLDEFY